MWDHLLGWDGNVVAYRWVLLAAVATVTRRIRIGPMVTPLPRRRPWRLAREAATLDHLSQGRLTLGVGIGTPTEADFAPFGEEVEAAVRAELLDEGLEVLCGLWSGEPFAFRGAHDRVGPVTFLPPPRQRPRIPLWVAGTWPHRRPFRRAARWDGVFPLTMSDQGPASPSPAQVAEILSYVRSCRDEGSPFDVAVLAGRDPSVAAEYAAAGVTWLQMGPDPGGESRGSFREWVAQGPPQV